VIGVLAAAAAVAGGAYAAVRLAKSRKQRSESGQRSWASSRRSSDRSSGRGSSQRELSGADHDGMRSSISESRLRV
jgi:hypothetical protein